MPQCVPVFTLLLSIDGPTHFTGQVYLFRLAVPGILPSAAKSETVMNRRTFLASLLATTASALLPVPLAKATTAWVDDVWHRLLDDPVYFEVDE